MTDTTRNLKDLMRKCYEAGVHTQTQTFMEERWERWWDEHGREMWFGYLPASSMEATLTKVEARLEELIKWERMP